MDALPVLMNASAGLARPIGEMALARALAEHEVKSVIEELAPGELEDHLTRLAGHPMVGVAGGDGTQRTAARVLAGSATVLVPFPTGTLNHFARRLGLHDVHAAARAVRTGEIRRMPVGRANGTVFVNTAVTGSYPRFIEVRDRLRPYLTKWPASGAAALHTFVAFPRVTVEVRTPEATFEASTALVWVGVGSHSFPFPHEAPLPSADDALEAVALDGGGRIAALRLAAATARHRSGSSHALRRIARWTRVTWMRLDSDRPIPVALDGERRLIEPPLTLRYEPGALRVLALTSAGTADGRGRG